MSAGKAFLPLGSSSFVWRLLKVAMIAKAGPLGKIQIALESLVIALVCETGSQLLSKIVLVSITHNL